MSLFDMFEDGAKLLGSAVGLKNLFDRPEPPAALRQAEEAALASRRYADAAANPDSPEFKNLAAIEEQKIKNDLVTSIEEIMKANRRAAATGRVGFSVNPERRDEFRSQAVARAFADAGERAKRLASDKLMAASNAASRSAIAFSPVINSQMYQDALGRQQFSSFLGGVQGAIGQVGDVFDLRGPTHQPQGLRTLFNNSPSTQQMPQIQHSSYSMPDIRRDYNPSSGRLHYA